MVEFALGGDGLEAFGEFGEDSLEEGNISRPDAGLEEGRGLGVG